MPLKFPDSADSADLAAAGYSQVIILGGGGETVSTSITADYLLLAGGGGGGGVIDGGGGAGGYRTSWGTGTDGSGGYSGGNSSLETALTLNNGIAYSITVGQGGEGGVGWNNTTNHRGHKGRSTSITGIGATVTTTGGGGGHGYNTATHTDRNGGSGGGGSYQVYAGGTRVLEEGFAGGTGVSSNEAGGGGGAGSAGGAASANVSGDGGAGLASTITGISITRAGGGGGGSRNPRTPGDGGTGGGGGGGDDTSTPSSYVDGIGGNEAEHGRAKYGAGGGGGGYSGDTNAQQGGNGGSGIAIFRIPSTVSYSASQLASDVSNDSNCTASYLNTQVYTDDTNFGSVNLLLDGSSTTDASTGQNPVTLVGNATANDTAVSDPFGGTKGSFIFDGSGDGIQSTDGKLIDVGNSQGWTVEMWIRPDTLASTQMLAEVGAGTGGWVSGGNSLQFYLTSTAISLQTWDGGTSWALSSAAHGMSANNWYHVAGVYDGSNIRVFVDGTQKASTSATTYDNSSTTTYFGYFRHSGLFPFDGRMHDIRVTNGVARYTSSFTPPTSAFPNGETSTGGDHVITFTVATEDPHDGGTTNDGTATWTPTLITTIPASPTTWTIPEGVDSFSIMAIGAGGAAGYSDNSSAGGGGGGGGLAYLNNIAVTQGNNEVQSITVGGGQLGIGNDSTGGDGADLTVTMNITTADPAMNLSGYTLNPYGLDSHDSSFAGILYVGADRAYDSDIYDSYPTLNLNFDDSLSSTADQFVYQQAPGPFGAAYPFSVGVEGAQTLFEIEADANYTYIQSLAETDPNTTNRWGYNTLTQVYSADSYVFRNIDNTGRNSLDSIQYYDSDVVATFFLQNTWEEMYKVSPFGAFDSIDVGNGAFTLFRIFSEADAAQIGALPGNSPYVDSNGQIVISTTGDPYDFNGYGPQDLNQILIVKNLTP